MNKEEAIKYLQQLYPNGGHCWLDEQRIEAIGMAVKALQEEPVSEDLLVAANKAWLESEDKESYAETFIDGFVACFNWQKRKDSISSKDLEELINTLSKRYPEVSFAKLSRIAVRVAKWQMAQMVKDVTVHVEAGGYPYIPQMELYDYDKDIPLAKEGDKYKVVLIKEG